MVYKFKTRSQNRRKIRRDIKDTGRALSEYCAPKERDEEKQHAHEEQARCKILEREVGHKRADGDMRKTNELSMTSDAIKKNIIRNNGTNKTIDKGT